MIEIIGTPSLDVNDPHTSDHSIILDPLHKSKGFLPNQTFLRTQNNEMKQAKGPQ